MVRCKLLVLEMDAAERDFAHLIVADAEPGVAGAYQEPVDAAGINQRDDSGIADSADLAPFKVVDPEAQQFGEEQDIVRDHRP